MDPIEQKSATPEPHPSGLRFRRFGEPALSPPPDEGEISVRDTRAAAASPEPALRQLTAETAHDFNNLLSVILACASELEVGLAEGPTVRERAAEIRAAAERGARLTRELIDAARPQVESPEPTELNRAVSDSIAMIERTAGERIEVRCDLDLGLPRVGVGRERLERILLNLTSNARDAMRGGGTLVVRTALVSIASGDPALGAGWYVCLSVSDDGAGMAADVIEHAVEPYFTTKGGGDGSGIGLPTVAGIARDAGGALRIGSVPGKGTTVSVHLPAIAANGDALALPPRGRRGNRGPGAS